MKKELNIFYFYFLLPLVFILIILALLPFQLVNMVVFLFSYIWNVFLLTPGMKDKVESKSYRFSFVKVLYLKGLQVIDLILKINFTFKYKEYLARAVLPLCIVLICKILYFEVSFFISLFGLAFFEFIYFFYKKNSLKKKD